MTMGIELNSFHDVYYLVYLTGLDWEGDRLIGEGDRLIGEGDRHMLPYPLDLLDSLGRTVGI